MARTYNTTAKKIDQQQRDRLITYLEKIPPADAVIMTAGIIAGSQGYTPLSFIMKALHSKEGVPEILPTLNKNSLGILGYTPLGQMTNYNINTTRFITDLIMGKKDDKKDTASKVTAALDPKFKELQVKYTELLALSSVGLIESYMITRPGAFAAAMNLLQSGVSSITGGLQGAAGAIL